MHQVRVAIYKDGKGVMTHKKCLVLVDNSNVFIEGQKYSAQVKGIIKSAPLDKDPQDHSWRIDFGNLLHAISAGRIVERAILVGSRPPQNDSVWQEAEHHGFDVTVHNRSSSGEEKAVDTELVAQATEFICCASEPMDLAIVSGDRDFLPLIAIARRRKWDSEMWAFTNAYRAYGQMATSVDRVCPLDDIFGKIGKYEHARPGKSRTNPKR